MAFVTSKANCFAVDQGCKSGHRGKRPPLCILGGLPPVHIYVRPASIPRTGASRDAKRGEARREQQRSARREVVLDAWKIVEQKYLNPAFDGNDWNAVRQRLLEKPMDTSEDCQNAVQWMLSLLKDPFTRFLPPEQLTSMRDDIDGQMAGVGIVIRQEGRGLGRRSATIPIESVVPGGPADGAGLLPGDKLVSINGIHSSKLRFRQVREHLQGPVGSRVDVQVLRHRDARPRDCQNLRIVRALMLPAARSNVALKNSDVPDHSRLAFTLRRSYFEIPSISHELMPSSNGHIGVIRVHEFSVHTAREARTALATFGSVPHLRCVVIDLRDNAGGVLSEAVNFSRLFVQGRGRSLVHLVGRKDSVQTETTGRVFRTSNRVADRAPLILVLMNKYSASASEVVAGALRNNCRAVLMGTSSFGKGSVQMIIQLADGSGVALTVASYENPGRSPIQYLVGLKPDIFLRFSRRPSHVTIKHKTITSLVESEERRARVCLGECKSRQRAKSETAVSDLTK